MQHPSANAIKWLAGRASAMIPIAKPLIGDEEQREVARVLGSGSLAQGPEVAAFEAEFAAFCGTKHALATTNGTTALHLALLAAGGGPGDEGDSSRPNT